LKITSKNLNVPFLYNTFFNSFSIGSSIKSINLTTFSQNLNKQFILNKYTINDYGFITENRVIKARYDYYFFDLKNAKEVKNNEIIIPFFRNNKIGFVKAE
jgi:hypothetical protein